MSEASKALEPLQTAIEAFETMLPQLRETYPNGTYVLFDGKKMLGDFKRYADALKAGYERATTEHFFVKQICKEGEDVAHLYSFSATL